MKTPKGNWKANQFDWDRISSLSDDECCFSLSQKEIALILTYTEMIGWVRRWYSETDATVNLSDIELWKSNLERKLMNGCCGDDGKIFRYLPDGTLESSEDGGITWTPDPDADPRTRAPQAPPLPGSDSSSKRCAAADNIRDQYKAMRDQCVALLTAGTTVLAIVAGLVAIIGFILSISVVGVTFGVILFSMAAALLSLTPEEVEEQIDDAALDAFRCIVYCHLGPDGRVETGGFDDILSDIADQFSGFPETFFYSITASLMATGLDNCATIGDASATDCSDCGCADPCDFAADLIYLGDVTDIVTNPDGTVTVTVDSADDGGGTQAVKWGDTPTFTKCCCIDAAVVLDPASPINFGIAPCVGSPFDSAVFVPGDIRALTVFQNGAFGTPFTMTITFNSSECE